MDQDAWARFRNRSRRIMGDWILGGLFGLGLGWFSRDFVGAHLNQGNRILSGVLNNG